MFWGGLGLSGFWLGGTAALRFGSLLRCATRRGNAARVQTSCSGAAHAAWGPSTSSSASSTQPSRQNRNCRGVAGRGGATGHLNGARESHRRHLRGITHQSIVFV